MRGAGGRGLGGGCELPLLLCTSSSETGGGDSESNTLWRSSLAIARSFCSLKATRARSMSAGSLHSDGLKVLFAVRIVLSPGGGEDGPEKEMQGAEQNSERHAREGSEGKGGCRACGVLRTRRLRRRLVCLRRLCLLLRLEVSERHVTLLGRIPAAQLPARGRALAHADSPLRLLVDVNVHSATRLLGSGEIAPRHGGGPPAVARQNGERR